MKCNKCNKIVPITRVLQPTGDALACVYCDNVMPVEKIAWRDGTFHFTIVGDVTNPKCPVLPRVLMKEQTAKVLNLKKIRARAIKIIRAEPNIRCICGEFGIQDSEIRVELLLEDIEK